jgi:heat shock protein HslJ
MRVSLGPALVVSLIVAGCADVRVSGINIDGTTWTATRVVGMTPIRDREPTLRFEGGRLNANDGCNGITGQGQVSVVNDHFVPGEMLQTLGLCLEGGEPWDGNAVADLFDAALYAADRIELRGEELVISGPAGELVFERAP